MRRATNWLCILCYPWDLPPRQRITGTITAERGSHSLVGSDYFWYFWLTPGAHVLGTAGLPSAMLGIIFRISCIMTSRTVQPTWLAVFSYFSAITFRASNKAAFTDRVVTTNIHEHTIERCKKRQITMTLKRSVRFDVFLHRFVHQVEWYSLETSHELFTNRSLHSAGLSILVRNYPIYFCLLILRVITKLRR